MAARPCSTRCSISVSYTHLDVYKRQEEYRAQAEEAHDHLCELVAEADDELMMKYLEGEETLTQEELEGLLSKAIAERIFVPV